MRKTDRNVYHRRCDGKGENNVSDSYNYGAYADAPQEIGFKATISAPFVQATALEALLPNLTPGSKVLDVGCGSGIMLSYMANAMNRRGKLVGLDCVQELVQLSRSNLQREGFVVSAETRGGGGGGADDSDEYGSRLQIVLKQGDGWQGCAEHGPYDAIQVAAAATSMPQCLVDQLANGGRLIIPVGSRHKQELLLAEKDASGNVSVKTYVDGYVKFVPMIQASKVDYDKRYKKGWAYGKKPNAFLVDCVMNAKLQPGAKGSALSLGEGQGRNVVYLAKDCGFNKCVAADASLVGLKKAETLASQRGVQNAIEVLHVNLEEPWQPMTRSHDLIISIFFTVPSEKRRQLHRAVIREALKPGGIFVLECFSPHQKVINERIGSNIGPADPDQFTSVSDLMSDFAGEDVEILIARETERELVEGNFHRLPVAGVTQFVLRKKEKKSCAFRSAIETVFSTHAENCEGGSHNSSSSIGDEYLRNAAKIVHRSLLYASTQKQICHFCWFSSDSCICDRMAETARLEKSEKPAATLSHPFTMLLHVIVVTHPCEFLRESSTCKLLGPVLSDSRLTCELLIVGTAGVGARLMEISNEDGAENVILYPQPNKSLTFEELFSNKCQPDNVAAGRGRGRGNGKLNLIVPDGSWKCVEKLLEETALANIIAKGAHFIKIDEKKVCGHTSRLIEALNDGSGKGRLTTAEAISIAISELGFNSEAEAIFRSVTTLADVFERRKLSVLMPQAAQELLVDDRGIIDLENAAIRAERAASGALLPQGLRWCTVCGAVLSSEKRMLSHVRGRKHLSCVQTAYKASGENMSPEEIFAKFSLKKMAEGRRWVDPPDVALSELFNP